VNNRHLVVGFAGTTACVIVVIGILSVVNPTSIGASSVGLIIGKNPPVGEDYAMGFKTLKAGWLSGQKSGDIGWYRVDKESFESIGTNAIVEGKVIGNERLEIFSVLVRDNELLKDCLPGGEFEFEPNC
jgi:hypothetical protein